MATVTNHLRWSQAFDNAAWFKVDGSLSVQANVATAPDGTATADRINGLNAATGDRVSQARVLSPQALTGSIWLKGEGADIGKSVNVTAKRNGAGTFAGQTKTVILTAEWQRVSCTFTMAADNTSAVLVVGIPGSNGATSTLVWGAQLEPGTVMSRYVPTEDAPVTSEDASGTAAASLPRLSASASGGVPTPVSRVIRFTKADGTPYVGALTFDAFPRYFRNTKGEVIAYSITDLGGGYVRVTQPGATSGEGSAVLVTIAASITDVAPRYQLVSEGNWVWVYWSQSAADGGPDSSTSNSIGTARIWDRDGNEQPAATFTGAGFIQTTGGVSTYGVSRFPLPDATSTWKWETVIRTSPATAGTLYPRSGVADRDRRVALRADAGRKWTADFETGDRSQWDGVESVDAADRLRIVPGPTYSAASTRSLRVRLLQTDVASSGVRNEVKNTGATRKFVEGEEVWLAWATMFPLDFQTGTVSPNQWHVWSQVHQFLPLGNGGPPVAFILRGEELSLRLMAGYYDNLSPAQPQGGIIWTDQLRRGVWQHYLLRVKWSQSNAVGRNQLWVNGVDVTGLVAHNNLDTDGEVYWKLGLYRRNTIVQEQVVHHDDFVVYTEDPRQPESGVLATLPRPTASASGAARAAGTSAATLPRPSASAVAKAVAKATATATLPRATSTGAGRATSTGTATGALGGLAATSSGGSPARATGASALPGPAAAGTGAARATGAGAATLARPAVTGEGEVVQMDPGVGAVSALLPVLATSATGAARASGAGASTLGGLAAAASGAQGLAGAAALYLPGLTAAATGTRIEFVYAAGGGDLAGLTGTGAGAPSAAGVGAGALATLAGASTGAARSVGAGAGALAGVSAVGIAATSDTATPRPALGARLVTDGAGSATLVSAELRATITRAEVV